MLFKKDSHVGKPPGSKVSKRLEGIMIISRVKESDYAAELSPNKESSYNSDDWV